MQILHIKCFWKCRIVYELSTLLNQRSWVKRQALNSWPLPVRKIAGQVTLGNVLKYWILDSCIFLTVHGSKLGCTTIQ